MEKTREKPLRLKGVLSDNRYFTGFWYHPEDLCRYHGSFQLLLESNCLQMKGQWIGYSESKHKINNGLWVLKNQNCNYLFKQTKTNRQKFVTGKDQLYITKKVKEFWAA